MFAHFYHRYITEKSDMSYYKKVSHFRNFIKKTNNNNKSFLMIKGNSEASNPVTF